jgi:hypothetical protein
LQSQVVELTTSNASLRGEIAQLKRSAKLLPSPKVLG